MTQDRQTLVKEWMTLASLGWSIRSIAKQFKVTTGQVSGAIYRAKNPDAEQRRKPRPPRQRQYPVVAKPEPAHIELYRHPDFKPVSLENLPADGCKYPVTALPPHKHCAMPKVHGKPYCQVHMDLCHRGEEVEIRPGKYGRSA